MSGPHGDGGTKAILAAFFANLGIAIAKFVGFLLARSSAMLAESIHSLADTGSQALLILGRRSRAAPTHAGRVHRWCPRSAHGKHATTQTPDPTTIRAAVMNSEKNPVWRSSATSTVATAWRKKRAGRVIAQGPPDELLARTGSVNLESAFLALAEVTS